MSSDQRPGTPEQEPDAAAQQPDPSRQQQSHDPDQQPAPEQQPDAPEQQPDASRAEGTSPEAASGSSPSAPAQPASRPRPQYGEYAPEGWEWTPEDPVSRPDAQSPAPGAPPHGRTAANDTSDSASGRVAGVPHNLGVSGGSTPPPAQQPPARRPADQPSSEDGRGVYGPEASNRSPESTPERRASDDRGAYRASSPDAPGRGSVSGGRLADRIITIFLLALGAYGALSFAASLFGLATQMRVFGDVLEIENFTVPDWLGAVGTISALAVLTLYAVTLIFSIQRMRARKLAFFIPLIAAVVAILIVVIASSIAIAGTPDLMQQFSDDPNGALNKLMEYSLSLQQ